ncbi:hypothetical protein ACHQM5_009625 [Ranunculus cassubicifolius]
MANLPEELITKIISHLPVKSLLRFRCVCKAWNSLINDTTFIQMHLHQAIKSNNFNIMLSLSLVHSIDYDTHYTKAVELDHPYKIIDDDIAVYGTSNGLVYIQVDGFILDVLWNPCTKEFKILPESPCVSDDFMVFHLHGFGYNPVTDDYRVVKVYQFFNENEEFISSQVMIYSLRMDSWKMVDGPPYFVSSDSQLPMNENPHWPAYAHPDVRLPKSIAYFDLADEFFCEIQFPKRVGNIVDVGVLGGCLCIVGGLEESRSDVWVMKEHGVLESWTKLFTINSSTVIRSVKPLALLFFDKNGKVLINNRCGDIVLYDLKCDTAEALEIQGLPTSWCGIHAYVGSLVSVKSGLFVDREKSSGKRRQNKKRGSTEINN